GHSAVAELPALYAHATLMVTTDSGPAHFSAAAGLPTIVLFGPETPKLYQPLGNSRPIYAGLACSPCVSAHNHRRTACTDNVCMRAINVDEVYAAVNEVLSAPCRTAGENIELQRDSHSALTPREDLRDVPYRSHPGTPARDTHVRDD